MVKIQQCRNQCGQQITVQLDTESGKYKPYDVDPTGSVIGLHNCPNSDYNKQKQWSSSNKQGQLTQYKIQQGLEHATLHNQELTFKKLHDIEILIHTLIEEFKEFKQQTTTPQPPATTSLGKKSEEFGEQGENTASNLEEYEY